MSNPILFERRNGIAYITLNRPDAGNALDVPLAQSLLDAIITAEKDTEIRCLVIRGNGKMFCAGGDVNKLYSAGAEVSGLLREILKYLNPAINRLANMPKPVITSIHGACAGGGIGLAAVGDIALAEPAAHFTMAYSKIGLSPDCGTSWILPRLIGLRRTLELIMTNRRIDAQEAANIGLITRVVAAGTLSDEVDLLANEFTTSAINALGVAKRLLYNCGSVSLHEQLDEECDYIAHQATTPEGKKGLAAFIERKKPDFSK